MKAIKKDKLIQSLLAFMRHFNYYIIMLRILSSIIIVLNLIFIVTGEPPMVTPKDSNSSNKEEKKLEVLFDDIMTSMPQETKVKVEAAKEQRKKNETVKENIPDKDTPLLQESNSNIPIKELPPEIREKVENLINQMDRKMEERKTRMRELNQKGRSQ